MRRVITVNLGGNAFQLDEDAYERLRAYLSLSESRLAANPDRAEIMGDLERAVADHIVTNRTATSAVVVSDPQMAQALSTVGTVEHASATVDPIGAATLPPPSSAPAWERRREGDSDYTRLPIFLLCLLVGWLGIHRFFIGKIGTGILMLLTLGGLGIWVVVDLILILLGEFKDPEGRKVVRWT
jgi:TM2 domain